MVLSQEEVARLIEASGSLMHRAMLMTLYSTGVRRTEAANLNVADIDSKRMVVHIRQGKGRRERDVPLSSKLLEVLRVLAVDETENLPVSGHQKRMACRRSDFTQDDVGSLP